LADSPGIHRLVTVNHGFDEFFGNLYHLNAEEEPENPDYPKASKYPNFKKNFGPRGVIHSFADGRITDTGPLTKKRMETIDEEVNAKAFDFMERAKTDDKPFFLWWNSTRMLSLVPRYASSRGWIDSFHVVLLVMCGCLPRTILPGILQGIFWSTL
jgi:arylsulfatase A-like enzyme